MIAEDIAEKALMNPLHLDLASLGNNSEDSRFGNVWSPSCRKKTWQQMIMIGTNLNCVPILKKSTTPNAT